MRRDSSVPDVLKPSQVGSLIVEGIAMQHLLGYGLWTLRHTTGNESMRDPIMTTLAIGVEKLLKLTLGLMALDDNGKWPSRDEMRDKWGHDLTAMLGHVLPALRSRLDRATHRPVVEGLLDAVESDPILHATIAALARYGLSGRFFYLDLLAESAQPLEQPGAYWDRVEAIVREHDPEVRAVYADTSTPDTFERAAAMSSARIADSLERLWRLLSTADRHWVLGERAGDLGDPDRVGPMIRDER